MKAPMTHPSLSTHPKRNPRLKLARGLTAAFAAVLLSQMSVVQAQEAIALDADDLQRLAIVFAPVQAVSGADGDRVPATVTAAPNHPNTVLALFEGQVQQWHVDSGSNVSAGEPLLTLRSEDLLLAQQEFLDAALALAQAEANLVRDQRLLSDGVIAEQRLQSTQREQQRAAAALAGTRQRLVSAGFSTAEVNAWLQRTPVLGNYVVRAPADAIVSERLVAAGAQVSDGEALVALQSTDPLWVNARVPARLAGNLSTGSTLTVADSDNTLILRQVDRQINNATQTVGIHAEFSGAVNWLPGQMVTLVLPPSDRGVRVPSEAVVHAGAETTVYVRTSTGAEARVLSLTPSGRNYIATSGLQAGEQVVVQGAAVLKGIQLGLGGTE
jgi:membrane fusion protein, heavy metal efflux system